MVKLQAPTGVLSASVGGVAVKVVDGFAEVDAGMVEPLQAHGFFDPRDPPADVVQAPAGDVVAIPRAAFMDALKNLGVALADNLPAYVLVQAFSEAAAQQAARVQHEVSLAVSQEGARYDAAKADIVKDFEARMAAAVAGANQEWEVKLASLGHHVAQEPPQQEPPQPQETAPQPQVAPTPAPQA